MSGFRSTSLNVILFALFFHGHAGTASANTTVIDFEGLASTGSGQQAHGKSYTESGFTFASTTTRTHNLATWQTEHPNYFGSTALWNGDGTGDVYTVLTRAGGGAFNLLSIDLAELYVPGTGNAGTPSVTFEATFSGGGTTSQGITLDNFAQTGNLNSFETLSFNGFNDIVSVRWLQVTPFHQFDNVTVSAVPVPAALPLFGACLALLGFFNWRGRRALRLVA